MLTKCLGRENLKLLFLGRAKKYLRSPVGVYTVTHCTVALFDKYCVWHLFIWIFVNKRKI